MSGLHNNDGFLPNIIILLTYYVLVSSRNPIKCPEELYHLQPKFPPNFPIWLGGCSELIRFTLDARSDFFFDCFCPFQQTI